MLSNTIKWLVQVWGFFSPLQLWCSAAFEQYRACIFKVFYRYKINKVIYHHRRWAELTHSSISSLLQPPSLVMVIAATGLGEVFPPGSLLLCWFRWRDLQMVCPCWCSCDCCRSDNCEGKQQTRLVHNVWVLSLKFPAGNISIFILFSNVCLCQQLSVNRSGSGPGKVFRGLFEKGKILSSPSIPWETQSVLLDMPRELGFPSGLPSSLPSV